ncbi:hypothetical protein [Rhodoferax sp.]|uniref:hypothetical protein n=1 Tax=Rhodoferax sp. TaxID=50421 RepID=UPI00374CEAF2
MSHLRSTVLTIALATAALGAWAQTDAQVDAQHKQHQANVLATEQATAAPAASAAAPASAEKMAAMDGKMKAMNEMHQKMMNAKTPEEKKALMAEHMKTMQEGMKTMGMMGGAGMADMQAKKPMPGNMGQHHQMMEKRMAMMESMMQMMMDRMPAAAAN